MADAAINDISKMKVIELRKELKLRGLPYAGDKSELIARLQAAMSQEDHTDINLDSDEIDSDGVLEEEDDKSQNDTNDQTILDDPIVDTLNEEIALGRQSPIKQTTDPKPLRTLKRKLPSDTNKTTDIKDAVTKKIVLNRTTSVGSSQAKHEEKKKTTSVGSSQAKHEGKKKITPPESDLLTKTNKIKITADIDPKKRLEMRAKRFGLPIKMTDEQRKEARKQRFNQNTTSSSLHGNTDTSSLTDNLDKLKKRAERFGQSVSAIMTDIENKERLEKRKAKFAILK